MRILIVGATGTIGRAVVAALSAHELILASREKAAEHVDISDPSSIRNLYQRIGHIDAVVSAAGEAKFAPLGSLSDADFAFCLANKLMGQVNLVRYGMGSITDGGSFTLTSGVLAQHPIVGSAAISLVNAALEGFTRAAALELQRALRVNVVSPPWVAETLTAMGQDPAHGLPAAAVARSYVRSIESSDNGAVITPER